MKKYSFISTTNMLVINNDKLLVIKRDDSLKDFPGWLMLPGGKQEASETPIQAAIRETYEETGLKVISPKLRIIATHNHFYRDRIYLVYIFITRVFSGKLIKYEEGKGTAFWTPVQEALNH